MRTLKKAETQRQRIEDELTRRKMKRRHDVDEFKVVEGVIDPPTMKCLFKLLNRGTLTAIHGAISTGKEANVYRGENAEGQSVAVKVYRMSTAETDFMMEYIVGDPRFKRVAKRSRILIPQWAMKEFKNLKRYHAAGIQVPEALDIERNVLVMEFIGDQKQELPAPLMKTVTIPEPVKTFNELINIIELGYTKAGLVHADLSEYNILWMDGPIIIDVSQAVLKAHGNSARYLYRDIKNLTQYFTKLGVECADPKEITKYILASGEKK